MFTKEMLVSVLDKLEKAGNLPPEISENTALLLKSAKLIEELQNELQRLESDNRRLREALLKIATTEHCSYDGNRTFISDHDSGYALGVADGHRLAANWARAALAQSDGKEGE